MRKMDGRDGIPKTKKGRKSSPRRGQSRSWGSTGQAAMRTGLLAVL